MKTCGIPSTEEVRCCVVAVAVAASGVSVTGTAVGTMVVSAVAEGSTTTAAEAGTCVRVGPAAGTFAPVQAVRKQSSRKVGMFFFMDFLLGVQELAPAILDGKPSDSKAESVSY
jgi:hypothetical protein